MKLKNLVSLGLSAVLGMGVAWSSPKGMGVDIVHPIAVGDYDAVSDEGGVLLNLTSVSASNKDGLNLYVNYKLGEMGRWGSVSTSFLLSQSEFSKGSTNWDAKEMQLSLYFNKSILKKEDDQDMNIVGWRPSKRSLNFYYGLGWANMSLDAVTNNFEPLTKGAKLVGNTLADSKGNALVANMGLVSSWSISKRHGVEVYGHVDQHFYFGGTVFGSPAPTLTLGAQYAYRLGAANYFPPELVLGLLTSTQQNDLSDGQAMGLSLSYRLRY